MPARNHFVTYGTVIYGLESGSCCSVSLSVFRSLGLSELGTWLNTWPWRLVSLLVTQLAVCGTRPNSILDRRWGGVGTGRDIITFLREIYTCMRVSMKWYTNACVSPTMRETWQDWCFWVWKQPTPFLPVGATTAAAMINNQYHKEGTTCDWCPFLFDYSEMERAPQCFSTLKYRLPIGRHFGIA